MKKCNYCGNEMNENPHSGFCDICTRRMGEDAHNAMLRELYVQLDKLNFLENSNEKET